MRHVTSVLTLGLLALATGCSSSQPATSPTPQTDKPGASGSAELQKGWDKVAKAGTTHEGLFTLIRDSTTGSLHLAITPEQLDKEYVYFTVVADGPVAAGTFRGQFRDNVVFSVRRRYDQVQFVVLNSSFWFDPSSALARAADANISPAILAQEKIAGIDSATGRVLIPADKLFLTEALTQIKNPPPPGVPPNRFFNLGSLSKEKSGIRALRTYPENIDVVVEYVFDNSAPYVGGGADVTDARSTTIAVQHSLIAMPENDYQPRFDDPRVGYFTTEVTDLTSTSATPWRDLVHRWSLVKQDPAAAMSEPVEPITFWIENTTPREYRETIRQAALAWNVAFEKAGFRNALVVREQPDDADWDANDLRYNVLRWTSSPQPPFGGYGPSYVNPRTGQILGADIMLEWIFVTNRLYIDRFFETAAATLIEQPLAEDLGGLDPHDRALALWHQQTVLFGLHAARAMGLGAEAENALINQSLYYLVLHEIGHTLGLNHNMKATQLWSPDQARDAALTAREGLYGSVMDYPDINISPRGLPQGEYYITRPGPYDLWAIEFAYSPALPDPAAEQARLEGILARSTEPALAFGNDADDMRAPGRGIDPRVMINDMSSDALTFAEGRIELVHTLLGELERKFRVDGRSYHEMRNAYLTATGQIANSATVASRYIGGVYVERAFVGQPGATRPYTPVSRDDQRRAMRILRDGFFAPDAFDAPDGLYAMLQPQRRGFGFFGNNSEDPKLHARVMTMHQSVLTHLLHPNTTERINDSELYGNAYPLAEMMTDLTGAIFDADIGGSVNGFRRNLQVAYVTGLGKAVTVADDNPYDPQTRAQAHAQLRSVRGKVSGNRAGDAGTRAHREYLVYLIDEALETD